MVMKTTATFDLIDDFAAASPAPRSAVRPPTVRRWLRVIGGWIERSRQRRALAELDGRLLADVGITRSAAAREIAMPFWR